MTYTCEQCNEPITDGYVAVVEIDGEKKLFHRQAGPVGMQEKLGSIALKDCTRDYMTKTRKPIGGQIMTFSNFEKLVQAEAKNTQS